VLQRQVRLSSAADDRAAAADEVLALTLVVLEGGGVVDLESAFLLELDPEEGWPSGTGGDMTACDGW
jgi:hypothetical protein